MHRGPALLLASHVQSGLRQRPLVHFSECSTFCSRCLCGCSTLDAHPKCVTVKRKVFQPAFLLVLLVGSPSSSALRRSSTRAELCAGLLSSERSESSSAERVEGGRADSNGTESWGLSPLGCGSSGFVSRSGEVKTWVFTSLVSVVPSHGGAWPSPQTTAATV